MLDHPRSSDFPSRSQRWPASWLAEWEPQRTPTDVLTGWSDGATGRIAAARQEPSNEKKALGLEWAEPREGTAVAASVDSKQASTDLSTAAGSASPGWRSSAEMWVRLAASVAGASGESAAAAGTVDAGTEVAAASVVVEVAAGQQSQ